MQTSNFQGEEAHNGALCTTWYGIWKCKGKGKRVSYVVTVCWAHSREEEKQGGGGRRKEERKQAGSESEDSRKG